MLKSVRKLRGLLSNKPMRKTITLDSYLKIKNLFSKNPTKEYTSTAVRDTLQIDYLSVKIALEVLKKEKFIILNKKVWRIKDDTN